MSRRSKRGSNKSSNLNLVPIFIGIAIAVVAIAAILIIPKILVKEKAPALDTKGYLAQSQNFTGNTFSLIGTISLMEKRDGLSLLLIKDENPDGTDVHLLVPDSVRDQSEGINLVIKNSYLFTAKVDDKNFLVATAIEPK